MSYRSRLKAIQVGPKIAEIFMREVDEIFARRVNKFSRLLAKEAYNEISLNRAPAEVIIVYGENRNDWIDHC